MTTLDVIGGDPGATASRRTVRGWVLEAGGEPPQVLDLDGWTEPGTAPDVENPLTALGHGDLSWAGDFDNVVNRLGFYDGTLDSDKITGPIAYLVCGWYADPTADPLGNQAITSLAGFNAAMQRLSWTLEADELEEVTFDRRAYVLAAKSFGLASTIDPRIAATNATPASDATAEYVTAGDGGPPGASCTGRWSASTGPVPATPRKQAGRRHDAAVSVPGADVLERGVENGSVPVECEGLLAETVLLDTGSAAAISAAAGTTAAPAVAERTITVEQTAWYSLRDPHFDHGPLIAHSGVSGMLPAPYSVAPAAHPWTPVHLEWSAEFVPSPRGLGDWDLGQIDYVLDPEAVVPAAGQGTVFQGRSPVTGGASNVLAAAVNNALQQAASIGGTKPVPASVPGHLAREAFYSPLAQTLVAQFQAMRLGPGQDQPAPLADIASALAQMDVLSCGLDGLLTQLRGGIPADGTSAAPGGTVPSPFFALRAGFCASSGCAWSTGSASSSTCAAPTPATPRRATWCRRRSASRRSPGSSACRRGSPPPPGPGSGS